MSFDNGGSFLGYGTLTGTIKLLNGRLDFLESGVVYDGSNVTIPSDLNVSSNVSCQRLHFNGTNQNTYLDAEEIAYKDSNGNNENVSIFYVEESAFNNFGVLSQTVILDPQTISQDGTRTTRVVLDSQRRCYTLDGVNQKLFFKLTVPELSNGTIRIPAVEHYFVFNKSVRGNFELELGPFDDQGNSLSGQLWALSTYKHYNTTGSLIDAGATTLTALGNPFPVLTSFKGFITTRAISLASPNDDGALCWQSEIWDRP